MVVVQHTLTAEVEYMPKKIKKFIGNKDLTANMFRIQAYDSIVLRTFVLDFHQTIFTKQF